MISFTVPDYLSQRGIHLDMAVLQESLAKVLEGYPWFKTRKEVLFTRFLPLGYTYVTLTCIDPKLFMDVLLVKTRIGILITLYDDLADHPERRNPKLLEELYKIPLQVEKLDSHSFSAAEQQIIAYAQRIWQEVLATVKRLPYYPEFHPFFHFDIQQFYNANRYSELISQYPEMANQTENRIYLSHNMGMVVTGMVDLMATPTGYFYELGAIRHVLFKGQIIGRLSNVLTTLERELQEGDITNEVCGLALQEMQIRVADLHNKSLQELKSIFSPIVQTLQQEQQQLYAEIQRAAIKTFEVSSFVAGLQHLHQLHTTMQGEI